MLWFGARLVVENKLSPGELSTFVIYAVYVGSNVGALAGVVSSLVQVCSSQCGTITPKTRLTLPSFMAVAPHFAKSCMRNCSDVSMHTNSSLVPSSPATLRLG